MATFIGGSGNDALNGGIGKDSLVGSGGNDTLSGGQGNMVLRIGYPVYQYEIDSNTDGDTMVGGTGDDTYQVTATASSLWATSGGVTLLSTVTPSTYSPDLVIELADEGIDTVVTFVSYALPDNVENLQLSGSSEINGTGNALNNVITGNSIVNTLSGLAGNDALSGAGGNDILTGSTGNDTLDGGSEIDTAIYTVARSNYTVTKVGSSYTVRANTGTDGTDTLTNVERLAFADGTLGLDTSGNSGQMYRLYKAAFDRVPDTPGLGHNIRLVDGGLTLAQMADAFVQSAEFTNTYGALSNAQFINQLYLNVLDRAPDAPGLAHNLNLLNTTLTRADLLSGFSESAENQLNVISQIQDGVWFT